MSDPLEKEHVLLLPSDGIPVDGTDPLGTLASMYLAETTHHLFGTHRFSKSVPRKIKEAVGRVCDAATDWFSEYEVFRLAPETARLEIEESVALAEGLPLGSVLGDKYSRLIRASVAARAVGYLGLPIEVPPELKGLVGAFLAVPPGEPTLENLRTLCNLLLAALGEPYRLAVIEENGIEVWGIEAII
ncbi:MAG: hypothetical protein ACPLQP_11700 [Moorellaceae bacterium]